MTEQQLFIAAITAVWGVLIWLMHKMMAHMDKALESCAQERAAFLKQSEDKDKAFLLLIEGKLQTLAERVHDGNRTLEVHTEFSKEHTHEHAAQLQEMGNIRQALAERNRA